MSIQRIALVWALWVPWVLSQSGPFPNPTPCSSAGIVVDTVNRRVTSATPFPLENCSVVISCPENQGIQIGVSGQATGTAYFNLKFYPQMAGSAVRTFNAPTNFHGPVNIPRIQYSSSSLYIQYYMMTPWDNDRQGGFTLNWQCFTNCPAQIPLSITVGTKGVINDTYPVSTTPIICVYTVNPDPCPSNTIMSWNFVKVPEYGGTFGTIDPNWKFFWMNEQPSDYPPVYFPFTGVATEQFLTSQTIPLQVRVQPNVAASWRVEYYCTPYSILPDAGFSTLQVMNDAFGVILSDPDGQGPIPFADTDPLTGQWFASCPYDTNINMNEIAYAFDTDSQQRLIVAPPLGKSQTYQKNMENLTDVLWGAPNFNVDFSANGNVNAAKGFTLKFECHAQCFYGPPQVVTSATPFVLAHEWMVAGPYTDMCRWEVHAQCTNTQVIKLHLVTVPLATQVFKVIVDYDTDWFRFAFPDKPQGQVLRLANAPFNVSVRGFPGNMAGFKFEIDCEETAVCGASWASSTITKGNASVLSDPDGAGPYPYESPGVPCVTTVTCATIQFSVLGDLSADGSQLELTYDNATSPNMQLFGSSIAVPPTVVRGPMTVRFVVLARDSNTRFVATSETGFAGGFQVDLICLDAPSQSPPVTVAPPTQVPPTTTVAPPTTTLAPPTTTLAPATTTTPPATTTVPPSPTPNTTRAPNTSAPPNITNAPPPPPTPPRHRRTATLTETLPIVPAAAAPSSIVAIAAGAAVGGLLLLLALCFFIMLRVRRMTVREAWDQLFHDPGKYTNKFEFQGDTDLEKMTAERAQNDTRANEELDEHFLTKSEPLMLRAAAAQAPAAAAKQTTQAPLFDVDTDDI